jgi:hypothetical protein
VSFNNPDTAEFSLDQDLCVANQVSGVGDVQTREVTMSAAMPNPFRTLNTLRFTMPRAGIARLSVFDVVGRRVRTLQDGWVVAGTHVRVWDRRTDYGTRAAAGVYFYRLEAGGKVLGQKVIAVR